MSLDLDLLILLGLLSSHVTLYLVGYQLGRIIESRKSCEAIVALTDKMLEGFNDVKLGD